MLSFLAEEEGFEPPVPRGTTVFKTAAFDHSATPLYGLFLKRSANLVLNRILANAMRNF